MKEFERWAKQNSYDRTETMKAWKAALRWAKAMHDVSSEPRFSLNITEELNGTSEKK